MDVSCDGLHEKEVSKQLELCTVTISVSKSKFNITEGIRLIFFQLSHKRERMNAFFESIHSLFWPGTTTHYLCHFLSSWILVATLHVLSYSNLACTGTPDPLIEAKKPSLDVIYLIITCKWCCCLYHSFLSGRKLVGEKK